MFECFMIVCISLWFSTFQFSKAIDKYISLFGLNSERFLPDGWWEGKPLQVCNKRLYEQTVDRTTCGNNVTFDGVYGLRIPEFTPLPNTEPEGGCYALFEEQKHTWLYFKKACKSLDGWLIVLSTERLLNDMKGSLGADRAYWVGGRRAAGKSKHKWLNGEQISVSVTDLISQQKEACVFLNSSGLYGDKCDMQYSGICYIDGVNRKVPVITTERSQPQLDYLIVGEKMSLSCVSGFFDGSTLALHFHTHTKGKYIWDTEGKTHGKPEDIGVRSFGHTTYYQFLGIRCLAWYNITVRLTVSQLLKKMKVHCAIKGTYKNKSYSRRVRADKSFVSIKSVTPVAKRVPAGLLRQGKTCIYRCTAMADSNNEVALTAISPSSRWGRVFKMDGKEQDIGEMPTWIKKIQHQHSKDKWWGGNYMNITLTLNVTPEIGLYTNLSCYSSGKIAEVLAETNYTRMIDMMKTSLNELEYISEKLTLFYNAFGVALRSRLPQGHKSTTVYGCDRMNFNCIGWPGSENRTLVFEIQLKDGVTTFTWEGIGTNLKNFMNFQTRETMDHTKGATMIITFTPRKGWQKDSVDQYRSFSCRMPGKPKFEEKIVTTLVFMYGNTPPRFKTKIEGSRGKETGLVGTCDSFLGEDETMTYELFDRRGNRFFWIVNMNGDIRGRIIFPWFRIRFVSAGRDENCGNVIHTAVDLILPNSARGLTLICYSLNVEEGNNTSYYNKSELAALVKLRKGGLIRNDTRHQHSSVRKAPMKMTSLIISLICGLCAMVALLALLNQMYFRQVAAAALSAGSGDSVAENDFDEKDVEVSSPSASASAESSVSASVSATSDRRSPWSPSTGSDR